MVTLRLISIGSAGASKRTVGVQAARTGTKVTTEDTTRRILFGSNLISAYRFLREQVLNSRSRVCILVTIRILRVFCCGPKRRLSKPFSAKRTASGLDQIDETAINADIEAKFRAAQHVWIVSQKLETQR